MTGAMPGVMATQAATTCVSGALAPAAVLGFAAADAALDADSDDGVAPPLGLLAVLPLAGGAALPPQAEMAKARTAAMGQSQERRLVGRPILS
jgi:hypothetical protein